MAVDEEGQPSTPSDPNSKQKQKCHEEFIAPDGGWGWIILTASFFHSVIVDGVCFAFGIFYLEFLDYFQEPRGKTAWIGSVLNGMYMIMGPVAGALANKYGCRKVAIAGSLWSAVAFFLSTMSTSVDMLILTFGVLGGMGFGLMYLPSIVIVGYYFDKKRAFATGIATCGSGIGAFIFAPLCKALIDAYAWQGAMWILAAIVLNGVVLGSLYRPLTLSELERYRRIWYKKQMIKMADKNSSDGGSTDSSSINTDKEYGIQYTNTNTPDILNETENLLGKDGSHSVSIYKGKNLDPERPNLRMRTISSSKNLEEMGQDYSVGPGDSWHSLSGFASSMDNVQKQCEIETKGMGNGKKDAYYLRSCFEGFKDIYNEVMRTMDFSMLKNPVFVIYGLSCILCMAGFFTPFIYLPDKTISHGYGNQKAAFLVSILGITNTVGRVITGWISDRPWADCLLINNCALIVGGIATILCPFCQSYALLAIYACVFGLCIAAFVSLRSIILVDLIGLDKLTSAFGIIVLCQGITSFIGAPIAGSLCDATGSYNVSFYVAGTTIALAGVICLPLRRIARYLDTNGNEKTKRHPVLDVNTIGPITQEENTHKNTTDSENVSVV